MEEESLDEFVHCKKCGKYLPKSVMVEDENGDFYCLYCCGIEPIELKGEA